MAFWNKKEDTHETVCAELRVPHEYADILLGLASANGYEHELLFADGETKTLRILLPKQNLDKVLRLCKGPGAKFL